MRRKYKSTFFSVLLMLTLILALANVWNIPFLPMIPLAHASYEDFTSYKENDGNNRFTVNSTHIVIENLQNKDQDHWVNKTYGTAYFTDFIHAVDVRGRDTGGSAGNDRFFFVYCNESDDVNDLDVAGKSFVAFRLVEFDDSDADDPRIFITECDAGTGYHSGNAEPLSKDTWYYLKINKTGTNFDIAVYTSSVDRDAGDSKSGTWNLTLTLHHDYSFSTIMAVCSQNSGTSATRIISGDVAYLNLNAGVIPNVVTLENPASDSTWNYNWTVNFQHNQTFYQTIQNASLHIENTTNTSTAIVWNTNNWNTSNVINNVVTTRPFDFSSYGEGTYKWNVEVFNSTCGVFASSNRTLTVDVPPRYQNVNSNTTTPAVNASVLIYGQGYDGIGLGWGWLWTNETGGTGVNYTSFTGHDLFSDSNTGSPKDLLDRLCIAFEYHYDNRIGSTYLSERAYDSGVYLPYVGIIGLQIYLRDGNTTILKIVERAFQEWYDNRNATTNLLRIGTSGGGWTKGVVYTSRGYMQIGTLALINSTFINYYEILMKGWLNYGYYSTTNLTYGDLQSDGTNTTSYCRSSETNAPFRWANLLVNCYKLTGNTTYLNETARILDALWKVKCAANLFAHKYHVHDGSKVDDYSKSSSGCILQGYAGIHRQVGGILYYDSTTMVNITNMIKVYGDALHNHYYDGKYWDYRLDPDTGNVKTGFDYEVAMGCAIDRGLLMASYELNNFTWMTRSKNTLINNYNLLNVSGSFGNGTVSYSASDTGETEAPTDFDKVFSYNLAYAQVLYLFYLYDSNNDSFKTRADAILTCLNNWKSNDNLYYSKFNKNTGIKSGAEKATWHYATDEQQYAIDQNTTMLQSIPVGLRGFNLFDAWNNSYIDMRTVGQPAHYNSPIDLNDVADTWTWSNYTWTNTSIGANTVIQWRLYYNDTYGNINGTSIHTFTVGGVTHYFYGAIQSAIGIASQPTWIFNIDKSIGITNTINHARSWTFNLYSSITSTAQIQSIKTIVWNIYSTIQPTNIINSIFSTLTVLYFYGAIVSTITIQHSRSIIWNIFSSINPKLSIESLKTIMWNLFSLIKPTNNINELAIFYQTLNFYGSILSQATITSQKSVILQIYSSLASSTTIASLKTVIFNIYAQILPTSTINSLAQFSYNLLNFFGSIQPTITLSTIKTVTWNIHGIINAVNQIGSIAEIIGTILNFYASINPTITILSNFAYTEIEFTGLGIAMIALVLALFGIVVGLTATIKTRE